MVNKNMKLWQLCTRWQACFVSTYGRCAFRCISCIVIPVVENIDFVNFRKAVLAQSFIWHPKNSSVSQSTNLRLHPGRGACSQSRWFQVDIGLWSWSVFSVVKSGPATHPRYCSFLVVVAKYNCWRQSQTVGELAAAIAFPDQTIVLLYHRLEKMVENWPF